ncbi:MAG: hypothetical protein GXZ15_03395 [Campylobacter sp.]|nr:hypothetical protein [Campylobacter sp.]
MNLEDEIKQIIEELKENKKREQFSDLSLSEEDNLNVLNDDDDLTYEEPIYNDYEQFNDEFSSFQNEIQTTREESEIFEKFNKHIEREKEFLISLKQRVVVLLEGLENFEKGDIEARVELNLKFMEFLLAVTEKRLRDISK